LLLPKQTRGVLEKEKEKEKGKGKGKGKEGGKKTRSHKIYKKIRKCNLSKV